MILVVWNHIYNHTQYQLERVIMIDSIIEEWSKRIPSGIIDTTNEDHLYQLLQVLNEQIQDSAVVGQIMNNIREQMRERY